MPKRLFSGLIRSPRRGPVAVLAVVALSVAGLSGVAQVVTAPAASAVVPRKAARLADRPQAEAVALAGAKASGRRVEVTAERTGLDTIWANPGGTLTDEMSQAPIRVKKAGAWVPVDETLTPHAGRLVAKAGPEQVSVSGDGSGPLVTLATAGSTSVGLSFSGAVSAPTVSGATATYPVVGAVGTSVQVASSVNGFSARVDLAAAPAAAPSYTFPLTVTGLTPSLDSGVLRLSNAAGAVVAQSAPLSMWDSSVDRVGDRTNQVPVTAALVKTAAGGTSLVLTPSPAWLADPGTKYPVTIDPDVSVVRVSGDTYTSSDATGSSPPSDTNYAGDYRVRVGSPDGTVKLRGFERFGTADYEGRDITSASLQLFQYYAATCTAKSTIVYSAVDDTTPATPVQTQPTLVKWDNQGTQAVLDKDDQWSSTVSGNAGASGCGAGRQAFDVTRMVNGFDSGEISNASFNLQAANESDSAGEKRFCSDNASTAPTGSACTVTGSGPILSLSYWPLRGTQPWYSLTSHPLNDHSTLSVNNDDGDTVIQAKDVDLNGDGLDLGVDRFYNTLSQETTSLGTNGWSLSVGPDVYLAADSTGYRYDYHAPGGTRFGDFVRQSTTSAGANYRKFFNPTFGGVDADLSDGGNDGNGIDTFTMTFHSSQTKYVFKKVDTSSSNLYLAQIKDRSGNTITFTYVTGTHQLSSITDTEGRSIIVTYTGGVITKISSTTKAADGTTDVTRTWQYGYTGTQLTSYTDPAGKVTTYGWTGNVITTITDPVNASGLAPTATLVYWTGNSLKQVTYSRASANGGNAVFGFVYYTSGSTGAVCPGTPDRWTTVTDLTPGDAAVNKGPTYCFTDRVGTVDPTLHVEDSLGHDKAVAYSADNQSDTSTSASNSGGGTDGSTVYTYGSLTDQVSKMTEPKDFSGNTAGTTSFDYANSGSVAGGNWLPTAQRDPSGNCNHYAYDSSGRTTDSYTGFSASSASGCETKTSSAADFHQDYNNSDGSVKDSYDGNGSSTSSDQETTYTYWATGDTGFVAGTLGQLESVVKPGGSCDVSGRDLCTTYTYDGAGRVASVTDGRNKTTRYVYDALDRTTAVELNGATTCTTADISAGNCVQYTYDAEGNLTARTDKAGTTSFTYDQMNRQLTQTYPGTTSNTTVFDGAGNRTQFAQTAGGSTDTVNYTYDIANRPATIADTTGTFTLSPDADGRPSTITYPSSTGVTAKYKYKNSGKPDTIKYSKSGASDLLDYTYVYTKSGVETDQLQTTTVTGTISALDSNHAFTYNTSNQLTKATNSAANTNSYAYDQAGNLTQSTIGTSSTSTYNGYDRAGELCWSGTGPTSTPPSSQLGTTCPATPSGYTARNLDNAGNNLGTTASPNVYNGNDQATTVGGVTQSYLDLGNNLRVAAGTDTTLNSPLGVTSRTTSAGTTFYTRDPSGTILDEHGAAGTHYYLGDYQGSIDALISTTGGIDGVYTYDPYGKTTINSQTATVATDNPWRYTGAYYDTEGDGNYHLAARYYDGAGHFTQPDALQGTLAKPSTMNSYGYADADPIDNSDPTGQSSCGHSFLDTLGNATIGLTGAFATATSVDAVFFAAAGATVPPIAVAVLVIGVVGFAWGEYSTGESASGLRSSCGPKNQWGS